MHCKLGTTAFVRASIFGGGAAGDTVWVVGVVAFTDGVWSGAVGVPLCIYVMCYDFPYSVLLVNTLTYFSDPFGSLLSQRTFSHHI